jgi:ABC-type antimicrobial peptide transport system permease subunit
VSIQLAIGALLGMTGAVAFARLLQGNLFVVSALDPATLVAVSAVLVLVGVGASVTPARRAMRLDPVVALRHD